MSTVKHIRTFPRHPRESFPEWGTFCDAFVGEEGCVGTPGKNPTEEDLSQVTCPRCARAFVDAASGQLAKALAGTLVLPALERFIEILTPIAAPEETP